MVSAAKGAPFLKLTVQTQLLVRLHTTAAVDMEVRIRSVYSEDMIQQLPWI